MKVTLKQTYTFLFFVGIFFIPFNSYDGIPFLGEYKRDGAVLFFLSAFFVFLTDSMYKSKLALPYKNMLFQFFSLFIFVLCFSVVVNLNTVSQNDLKNTSGISRFIRQFISLGISMSLIVLGYNILKNSTLNKVFLKVRQAFLFSFVVVALYGFIEILVIYFNFTNLKSLLLLFDYFPFTDVNLDHLYQRISSVTLEPPFLAIYLITIAGWMFSYIITAKGIKKYIPAILVFVLTFFSGSRTALIVVSFQFIVFLSTIFYISRRYRSLLQKLLFILGILFLTLMVFNKEKVFSEINKKWESLNFVEDMKKSISNRSRFGIQYTSLLIFQENPIFGVGFGQQAYHAVDKYPTWVTKNNYEFKEMYFNDAVKSFPPGFNLYTRLLAETGIVGTCIFLSFALYLLVKTRSMIKKAKAMERVILIVLLVSFVGFFINWLQFDSFRMYGFWICLAMIMRKIQLKYE